MKLKLLVLLFSALASASSAQETDVKKYVWGVQLGIPGLMLINEFNINNWFALKSEVGLGGKLNISVFGFPESLNNTIPVGISYGETGIMLTPAIAVEPRFYFGRSHFEHLQPNKRTNEKSRYYIALNANYNPAWFTLSSFRKVYNEPSLSVTPVFAEKSLIGKSMYSDIGGGIGYWWRLAKVYPNLNGISDSHGLSFIIRMRIGFILK
jgi:hypothetical protein